MSFRSTKSLLLLSLVLVGIALVTARPEKSIVVTLADIHNSEPVKLLNKIKHAVEEEQSPLMRKVFAVLFPFGPAWNSILGTFYISSVPNFILAFIPAQIAPDTLNTMTAFATGGLLSDVFLHLMPHSFLGEGAEHDVSFVMREEKKNVLVGLAVFVGFAAFFFMEKTFRVLGSEDGHSHGGHSHSHAPVESVAVASGTDALTSGNELTARGKSKKNKKSQDSGVPTPSSNTIGPSKTSAFLNLFGDFLHNITDGLAMAASFYASPAIGATTTLACFAHEIPHEIADYSILIRSGLTKKQAMQSQFLTAIGAFIGTFIGIAVHSVGAKEAEAVDIDLVAGITQTASGILGTTLQVGELMIPFVAGGFLYIGAVAVLPTLLAESKSGKQALREFAAMALGVTCMFLVAWNE